MTDKRMNNGAASVSGVFSTAQKEPLTDPAKTASHTTWSHGVSVICTVIGAACLWAWGYVASLSQSLFPTAGVVDSIGIEFCYFTSQLTLFVIGMASIVLLRRWHPVLPPAVVVLAAVLLAAASFAIWSVLHLSDPPFPAIIGCGIAEGLGGMILTISWGARFSLGSRLMRRMVLLSFLLGYVIYLIALNLPLGVSTVLTIALPLVSGALWLFDSWRRHLRTSEVWPVMQQETLSDDPAASVRFPGEGSAGSTNASVLPWRTLALFSVASLIGNFIASFLMGSTYEGAAVIYPGGFLVCGCITIVAVFIVGSGSVRLSVRRLYRYCLPFAVLGMLLIVINPTGDHALASALVTGIAIFLQALVILEATEATQETGVSPMLSFGAGQGLIGGTVFFGCMLGRISSEMSDANTTLLVVICCIGIFILFFLLLMEADRMAARLAIQTEEEEGDREGSSFHQFKIEPDTAVSFDDEHALDLFSAQYNLTPREKEVCAYLVHGRSLPYIAEQLFVTAGTVKTHSMHIYRKTGVSNKQELMDLFVREGSGSDKKIRSVDM